MCSMYSISNLGYWKDTAKNVRIDFDEYYSKWFGEVDILLDNTGFSDPQAKHDKSGLKNHTGQHDEIIKRVVDHDIFESWLEDAHRQMKSAILLTKKNLVIVSMCNHGRHRSVAGSLVMKYILTQLGFFVEEPLHMGRTGWRSDMC